MDAIARSTARSTATMREHNVARRRMGKPFTRKPFGPTFHEGWTGTGLLRMFVIGRGSNGATPTLWVATRGFLPIVTVNSKWDSQWYAANPDMHQRFWSVWLNSDKPANDLLRPFLNYRKMWNG